MKIAIAFAMVALLFMLWVGDVEGAVWVNMMGDDFKSVLHWVVVNKIYVSIIAGAIGVASFTMHQKL
jgi:roadblock/LC7 domain-containing protein